MFPLNLKQNSGKEMINFVLSFFKTLTAMRGSLQKLTYFYICEQLNST